MKKADFSTNPNGKLFNDTFGTVRMPDPDKYFVGSNVEVTLKGMTLGIAQVVAIRSFEYIHIRDPLSFLECGKPAHFLAELTRRYYNPEGIIEPGAILYHVMLQYTRRDIDNQTMLLQQWWSDKIEESKQQQS